MSQPLSRTRLLLLIAALTNPFCWLPCITAVRSALADVKTGDLRGIVFTVDPAGGQSVMRGVNVTLNGPSLSIRTVSDERGSYSFTAVAPGAYRIQVKAPGLIGSNGLRVVAGRALDFPIQLKVEAVKESVTPKGSDEPATLTESSGQTVRK